MASVLTHMGSQVAAAAAPKTDLAVLVTGAREGLAGMGRPGGGGARTYLSEQPSWTPMTYRSWA